MRSALRWVLIKHIRLLLDLLLLKRGDSLDTLHCLLLELFQVVFELIVVDHLVLGGILTLQLTLYLTNLILEI
jgi:hypothetical protein